MTPLLWALFGGVWGVSRQQVSIFERAASQAILRRVQGPEAQITVRADVGLEALWGEIESVKISGTRFTVSELPLYVEPNRSHAGSINHSRIEISDFFLNGLRVESLTADIPDCKFDFAAARRREFHITGTGEGTGTVIVRDADLCAFAKRKFPIIKSLTMSIRQDKIFVEGRAVSPIFAVDFWIVSSLQPLNGTKRAMTNARVMINGRLSDRAQTKALLTALNPIVDLNRDLNLHDAMTVKELTLRDGVLKARGDVRFATLREESPKH